MRFQARRSLYGAKLHPSLSRHHRPAGSQWVNHVLRRANPDNRMKTVAWGKDFVTCLEQKIALDSPPEERP